MWLQIENKAREPAHMSAAIAYVAPDATGAKVYQLPITPEQVRKAISENDNCKILFAWDFWLRSFCSRRDHFSSCQRGSFNAILALIPGSGYIYSGHIGDGITAFMINALWIAGVVTGIHAEYYAVAGIVAGVGVPFYLGNIYGSANAAQKWNLNVKRDLRNRVYLTLDFNF